MKTKPPTQKRALELVFEFVERILPTIATIVVGWMAFSAQKTTTSLSARIADVQSEATQTTSKATILKEFLRLFLKGSPEEREAAKIALEGVLDKKEFDRILRAGQAKAKTSTRRAFETKDAPKVTEEIKAIQMVYPEQVSDFLTTFGLTPAEFRMGAGLYGAPKAEQQKWLDGLRNPKTFAPQPEDIEEYEP